MAKEVKRKSILVNAECFSEFNELRRTLNLNSSETLQTLLQKEITKTEIIDSKMNSRIEPSAGFNHIVKEMSKRGD